MQIGFCRLPHPLDALRITINKKSSPVGGGRLVGGGKVALQNCNTQGIMYLVLNSKLCKLMKQSIYSNSFIDTEPQYLQYFNGNQNS